jgi:hypothetical protein
MPALLHHYDDDMFALVCSINTVTVHDLATLCCSCKKFRDYLLSKAGAMHWYQAAKRVCGPDHWREDCLPGQPHANDLRYTAMLRLAPWLSVLTSIDVTKGMDRAKAMWNSSSEFDPDHLILRRPPATSTDPFVHVYVEGRSHDDDDDDTNHRYYKLTMNPRPFGPSAKIFTASPKYLMTDTLRWKAMTAQEMEVTAMASEFFKKYPCFLHKREVVGTIKVHDNAYAIHLDRMILFFAIKPTFRFLAQLRFPIEIARNISITFGIGEFWVVGRYPKYMYDWSLLYVGPRHDKRTLKPNRGTMAIGAFFAAEAGDVKQAVAILRRHRCKLTTLCWWNQMSILHYAAQANHIDAVRTLVTKYKMPIDLHTDIEYTAINIAAEHGHTDMIAALEGLGAKGNFRIMGKARWPRDDHAVYFIDRLLGMW